MTKKKQPFQPWECVRCGNSIPGRSASSSNHQDLGNSATDPFCSRKCLLDNRVEYEAYRKTQGLPPGLYSN